MKYRHSILIAVIAAVIAILAVAAPVAGFTSMLELAGGGVCVAAYAFSCWWDDL